MDPETRAKDAMQGVASPAILAAMVLFPSTQGLFFWFVSIQTHIGMGNEDPVLSKKCFGKRHHHPFIQTHRLKNPHPVTSRC